jgi:hypothetical protein
LKRVSFVRGSEVRALGGMRRLKKYERIFRIFENGGYKYGKRIY